MSNNQKTNTIDNSKVNLPPNIKNNPETKGTIKNKKQFKKEKAIEDINILDSNVINYNDIKFLLHYEFKNILKPLYITNNHIKRYIIIFISNIKEYLNITKNDILFKKHHNYEDFLKKIQIFLMSEKCIKFYGLLAHFIYWNILHPFTRRSIIILNNNNISNINIDNYVMDTTNNYNNNSNNNNIDDNNITNNNLNEYRVRFNNNSTIPENNDNSNNNYNISSEYTLSSETSLTQIEKEEVYVNLQEVLLELRREIGCSEISQKAANHTLLICCHIVIDDILTDLKFINYNFYIHYIQLFKKICIILKLCIKL
jgi:hypothetical protein